jgi:uncharacterized protein (TIGR02001 family)
MKFMQLCAGATLGVVTALASPAVLAGALTGNADVVSDYVFRGVDQTATTPAVQGGADYSFDIGAYSGLWVSNALSQGGTEADIYAGYGQKLGGFDLDGGLIYYWFSERKEASLPTSDYPEIYVSGGFGPASLKVFYANAYGKDNGVAFYNTNGKKDQMLYVTASANFTLTETVSVIPQAGYSTGKGVKDVYGDNYADFSVTAVKKLENDLSISLQVVDTTIKDSNLNGTNIHDQPKFIVGLKKTFKVL